MVKGRLEGLRSRVRRSDPEWLRVTVYPRLVLGPPFISVSLALSLALHPVSLSPSLPRSSLLADLPCPLMVLRLAQSATYHRFPLRSIPGRAQPLCERYLGRRTARGNL